MASIPIVTNRSSSGSLSCSVSARSSVSTVAASAKSTPCLRTLMAAFSESHWTTRRSYVQLYISASFGAPAYAASPCKLENRPGRNVRTVSGQFTEGPAATRRPRTIRVLAPELNRLFCSWIKGAGAATNETAVLLLDRTERDPYAYPP